MILNALSLKLKRQARGAFKDRHCFEGFLDEAFTVYS
ncbi:hypothetical protein Mnod_3951 [Methylobacterium nodulans ORS 2060]|uniref:Uncharacterized protein n=1 Tax=Methylobacterium nodulans (strain LMG 21967 / CNCM I-2342 / ORS 2060) TaxID=460265 RepID=B8ISK3_METNO|nr:hypothetical protein Mnod_3951 [Methylobacterium nodulans ORS 2060]